MLADTSCNLPVVGLTFSRQSSEFVGHVVFESREYGAINMRILHTTITD